MKEKKVHLKDPEFVNALYHFDCRLHGKSEQLTSDPSKVTCKRCLYFMAKHPVVGA